MDTITIPFWIFALSFGLPCVSMLFLVGFLLRKIRSPKKNKYANMCLQQEEKQQASSQKFHNDLLRMQVDTIFNGLNAIIETERLKINALLSPNNNFLFEANTAQEVAANEPSQNKKNRDVSQKVKPSLEQQLINMDSSEKNIDELANEFGLSQTEIDLAMRMRSSRESNQGRKLEAVA